MSSNPLVGYSKDDEVILADRSLSHAEAAAKIGKGKSPKAVGTARRLRGIRIGYRLRPEKSDVWSPEQDALLRAMVEAGDYRCDIADALAAECGVTRSDGAIYTRCRTLGIAAPLPAPVGAVGGLAPRDADRIDEIFAGAFVGHDVPVRPSRRTIYARTTHSETLGLGQSNW